MNLSALTDPNPKPYLDINCNQINGTVIIGTTIATDDLEADNITCDVLTANTIINSGASSATFSAFSTGNRVILAGEFVTDLCDTFEISSPDFNMLTNIYTAPVAGDYLLTFIFSVVNSAAVQRISLQYGVTTIPIVSTCDFSTTVAAQRNSFEITKVVRLTAGQTIGYNITNLLNPNVTIQGILFQGKLLQ